jgi:hypothetical protein
MAVAGGLPAAQLCFSRHARRSLRPQGLPKLLPLHYSSTIKAGGISFHVVELLLSGPEPGLSLIHLQLHIVSLVASAGGLFVFPIIL